MILRRAEVEGACADVRLERGRVAAIAPRLDAAPGEGVLDAEGGALLPGLHDHHLHAMALAASLRSIHCGPAVIDDRAGLEALLREATPDRTGWIRAVDYHESVAGPLDCDLLDGLRGDVPVRLQHRTGALWILNSKALSLLAVDGSAPPGAERDARGALTGRLFREDAWLRDQLPTSGFPDLSGVGARLGAVGVTGFTDATPTNGADEVAGLAAAGRSGALPQRVHWMGGPELPAAPIGMAPFPYKVMVDERTLATPDELAQRFSSAHAAGRPVAVHCVTRAELVVTCAALEAAGPWASDRIEHASVAPPDTVGWLARLGVSVVTQPHFIRERGDSYLRDVDARDQPWLYRCAGLEAAGVRVGGGTDAPYGAADPWLAMAAAVDRKTAAGSVIGPGEAISPERALALFTTPPDDPGGLPRRIAPGAPADLCLLARPWAQARDRLAADSVRYTFCAGEVVYAADRVPS